MKTVKHIHDPEKQVNERTGRCQIACYECGLRSSEEKSFEKAWDSWKTLTKEVS